MLDGQDNDQNLLNGAGDDDDAFVYTGADSEPSGGDYSTQLEELLGSDNEEGPGYGELMGNNEEEEDEGFVYSGVDAEEDAVNYNARLREAMGSESDTEEVQEVEHSMLSVKIDPDESVDVVLPDPQDDSEPGPSLPVTPPRTFSPPLSNSNLNTPSKPARPFLHPHVSRLRSNIPTSSPSSSSIPSLAAGVATPSHFSAMSRMSSQSNLQADSLHPSHSGAGPSGSLAQREIFRWSQLRNISQHLYASAAHQKASHILGAEATGTPTVLAANGLICVGTTLGKICVYDFKQTLKCICGSPNDDVKELGPVTALALSHDHTFVAAGHATGYIRLFDLKAPTTPARVVPPTKLSIVASGRKEGHLKGSRIVNIGFIAGRHTAIVSADENGLAFYHSLGKVLFVEATDILRILGKYPLDEPPRSAGATAPLSAKSRARYTILAMAPLPLGPSQHPTDQYNLVALLTPTKLVVVGLKPSPKTWFKCSRPEQTRTQSRWKGTLSWYPSVIASSTSEASQTDAPVDPSRASLPCLAYTWGNQVHFIRVSETKSVQPTKTSRGGQANSVEVGNIVYTTVGTWSTGQDILAVQWLNVNQLLVVTADTLEAVDVNLLKSIEKVSFDSLSLVLSPSDVIQENDPLVIEKRKDDVSHSVRTYKGKIFLLGRNSVQVGTLLTWADRILTFVQDGDFLSAIELTRSYYLGTAPGNLNGLPDELEVRKAIIGKKLHGLMVASAEYAFSPDRMTDNTHTTPDGRGVDRTSLFEGLVSTCCRACVALDDTDFLFEDLFQHYDDNGISSIFLQQLEPFVLENEIRFVPPRLTKRLIMQHDEDGRPDLIERLIWHIDPLCLDIDQAIMLCEQNRLYDALIYVYTRALKDYVAPVVKLLALIRQIFQTRRSQYESSMDEAVELDMESVIVNAYKIYTYLGNVLSGLTYPSEEPLDPDEALMAKKTVYTFLFFGRSSVWPAGEGGKLVLTADEDGGMEPTYPYARQLLRFDAESFLHSLDIAFEDSYLNDKTQSVSRSLIIRILLEIVASDNLSTEDISFVNIFVARNVPKYPQFLQDIPPSTLHNVLIGLAEDNDPETREDRQLAAEFLLSVYNPHESERIVALFQEAGFYRILRMWHRQDKRWGPLLSTYLDDVELQTPELFDQMNDVLVASTRAENGYLPPELVQLMAHSLPYLLGRSVSNTATIIDTHAPELHEAAVHAFDDADSLKRFLYLRHLLGPPFGNEDEYNLTAPRDAPSLKVPSALRRLYIALHCTYQPSELIPSLQYLPPSFIPFDDILQVCEEHEVFDAVVWAINRQGDPRQAMSKSDAFEKRLTLKIVEDFSSKLDATSIDVMKEVHSLRSLAHIGVSICVERSQEPCPDISLEDIWFQLLSSQINCVQSVSGCCSPDVLSADSLGSLDSELAVAQWNALTSLRALVRDTFASLVSITSTKVVSFPRLFKRLVDSVPQAASETQYTEFRTILTGMLESYRSDGDMLIITKHLVDRDLFQALAEVTQERNRGWTPSKGTCSLCRKSLYNPKLATLKGAQIVISRTGTIRHATCT